jgi:cytoskeletal protein RodZ
MTKYLKFAGSFWMSAFLVAGTFGIAQTTPAAKAKKNGSTAASSTPAASANNSSQTPSGSTTEATAAAPQTNVVANDQATTTPAAKPKTMIGPGKHTIPVPQSN